MLRRFEREAQATAALSSPHTIRVFDFGVTDDGTFYYVMELLAGRDLESLVREFGPVPADRAIYLLRQVCHSLADAHARGLVHRDIKPANIYVCRMGLDYDFVKVLDFGLVKFNDQQRDASTTLMTGAHTTTGTPAYMAPEIILGEGEVDRRADVYALGCVAYYLLTGQLVFEADTPMKMFLQHVQTPPVPPSQRTELHDPARARRAGAGVPREGSEPAAAGCRASCFELACDCCTVDVWNNAHGQGLVGDAPDRADRPADADAIRGPSDRHPGRRDSRMRSSIDADGAALPFESRSDEKVAGSTARCRVFTDVRAGEGATAVLMLLNIFLLLICYSVIKTVREPLILLGGGAEVRSYAAAGQALLLMGFVPLLQLVRVARRPRQAAGRRHAVLRRLHRAVRAGGRRARAVRRRRVLHLGRHLQHLAGRAVLVVRQRHLHQGGRRPAVPDHRDRHDRRRAARLARRRRGCSASASRRR